MKDIICRISKNFSNIDFSKIFSNFGISLINGKNLLLTQSEKCVKIHKNLIH